MSILDILQQEELRQQDTLSLIPSENYTSPAVRAALSSVFVNKYAEGYPGRRYYAGNAVADLLEARVQELAREVFATDYHVNVQPHSGSPANLAVYHAFLKPGDTILSLRLDHGGHLSHGHSVTFVSSIYNIESYEVNPETEQFDYVAIREKAVACQPKMIVCGGTAYPADINFAEFRSIADEVGAHFHADISHVAGLIAGGVYSSPFGLADTIMTTTHKTLRGPRGAMIFTKLELAKQLDKAVFPGLQGGPHLHTIAALGIALEEASQPAFKQYAAAIIENAKALADTLQKRGIRLVSGGTESHLLLADLRPLGVTGAQAQELLESVGLITNKNTIPHDPAPPLKPSGLRLGTPGVTTRGMGVAEMAIIGGVIADVLTTPTETTMVAASSAIADLCRRFPLPN